MWWGLKLREVVVVSKRYAAGLVFFSGIQELRAWCANAKAEDRAHMIDAWELYGGFERRRKGRPAKAPFSFSSFF